MIRSERAWRHQTKLVLKRCRLKISKRCSASTEKPKSVENGRRLKICIDGIKKNEKTLSDGSAVAFLSTIERSMTSSSKTGTRRWINNIIKSQNIILPKKQMLNKGRKVHQRARGRSLQRRTSTRAWSSSTTPSSWRSSRIEGFERTSWATIMTRSWAASSSWVSFSTSSSFDIIAISASYGNSTR